MSALEENSRPEGAGVLPTAGRAARVLTTAVPLGFAIGFFVAGLADPEATKAFVDRMTAHGSIGRLPLEQVAPFQERLRIAGGLLVALAALTAVPRLRVADLVVAAVDGVPALLSQAGRGLIDFVREERGHALFLGALVVTGLGLALFGLHQPIRCDEGLTAMHLAPRSPLYIATTYGDANNHILHTLAVSFSWTFFGHELWSLRLPALVAGLLVAPATYAMVRALFSRSAAVVAAAMVGTSPFMLDLATNARGYSLVNLVFVALLAVSTRLVSASKRAQWVAFVLLSVAGFYTVPTMAYPFAIVVAWLLISAPLDLPRSEWRPFFLRLGASVAAVVLVTAVLYSPTLLFDGTQTTLTAKWVRPSIPTDEPGLRHDPTTYYAFVVQWVNEVYKGWKQIWMYGDLRQVASIAFLVFPLWCLVRRRFSHGMRLIVAAAVTSLGLVLLLASLPPRRSISFFFPIGAATAAAGLVIFLRAVDWIFLRVTNARFPWVAAGTWTAAVLVVLLNARVVYDLRDEHAFIPWYVGYYDAQDAVAALEGTLQPEDRIIGEPTELPPVEFYIERLGHHHIRGRWVTGVYWATVARHEEVIDDLYLIEPQQQMIWRESKRGALIEAMEAAGFVRTDEVTELPTSRVVRYTLTPGD